jgi:DNA gyrase/topoisomerase IV subunit A
VRPVERSLLVAATARRVLVTEMDQVKVLAGAGQGVRIMNPEPPGILECFTASPDDVLLLENPKGKVSEVPVAEFPRYRRGAKGAVVRGGIARIKVKKAAEPWEKAETAEGETGAVATEAEVAGPEDREA